MLAFFLLSKHVELFPEIEMNKMPITFTPNLQLPFQDELMKSIEIPINKIQVTPRKTMERPIFHFESPSSISLG